MGEMMKTFSEVINDVKVTMMQNKIPGKENESRSSDSNDNSDRPLIQLTYTNIE